MRYLTSESSNLASIIMGKGVWLPWRGQPDLVLQIPFKEWFTFIKENRQLLMFRSPLKYEKILDEDVPERVLKFYLIDCSWALYNEVMVCANQGYNSTVVVPECDDPEKVSIREAIDIAKKFPLQEFETYYGRLSRLKPLCREIPLEAMSNWNVDILMLSVYIQYLAYQEPVRIINFEWR